MENKIEILKKLGFSDEYLKILDEYSQTPTLPNVNGNQFNFESVNIDTPDYASLIIGKTEKTINSDFIYNQM